MNTATAHLLKSKKARSYKADNGKTYVLDIKKEGQELVVTTSFTIPQTRVELNRTAGLHLLRILDGQADGIDQVALRYYLDILRRNG